MQTLTLNEDKLLEQLEEELKMLHIGEPAEMGLSQLLGNDGKHCTLTKECMPMCN